MDDSTRTQLSAGARVTYDGQAWEVAELTPPSVLLAGPAGGLRRVSISHLLAAPGTRIGDTSGAERPADAGLRLASLSRAELATLAENSLHASFLPAARKQELVQRLRDTVGRDGTH